MDAESYQHEMQNVLEYNHKTGSAYYPLKEDKRDAV